MTVNVGQEKVPGLEHNVASASFGTLIPLVALAATLHFFFRKRSRPEPVQRHPSHPAVEPTPTADSLAEDFDNATLEVLPLRYCPVCHCAYLPETETCDECGVELQAEPPEDELGTTPYGSDSTIRVARIPDPIRCNLVIALLRNQGIPCTLSQATVLGHHGGDIYVLLRDAYHAKFLIREYLSELEKEKVET